MGTVPHEPQKLPCGSRVAAQFSTLESIPAALSNAVSSICGDTDPRCTFLPGCVLYRRWSVAVDQARVRSSICESANVSGPGAPDDCIQFFERMFTRRGADSHRDGVSVNRKKSKSPKISTTRSATNWRSVWLCATRPPVIGVERMQTWQGIRSTWWRQNTFPARA
jgi:hypothetical protein